MYYIIKLYRSLFKFYIKVMGVYIMKFKNRNSSLGKKIASVILPMTILSFSITTFIGLEASKKVAVNISQDFMYAELNYQKSELTSYFETLKTVGIQLSDFVQYSSSFISKERAAKMIDTTIENHEELLGCGIWFNPAGNRDKSYCQYAYRDPSSGEIKKLGTSHFGSSYMDSKFYKECSAGKICYTKPYKDDDIGALKVTCAVPIKAANNTYRGCITVDINQSKIIRLLKDSCEGKDYNIIILSGGEVLGSSDTIGGITTPVEVVKHISSVSEPSGAYAFHNLLTFYTTIDELNWKVVISVQKSQLYKFMPKLAIILYTIQTSAVLTIILILYLFTRLLHKRLNVIQNFSEDLSNLDYTLEPITDNGIDEVSSLTHSVNKMYDISKNLIKTLVDNSQSLNLINNNLKGNMIIVNSSLSDVNICLDKINEGTMTSSAATQELNASMEHVKESVEHLKQQASLSENLTNKIKAEADKNEHEGQITYQKIITLAEEYKLKLQASIEKAECVKDIEKFTHIISEIAEDVSLLSLNASIEAARVGEQGKGFAVVANEVGKLAQNTNATVDEIQKLVTTIGSSFNELTLSTRELIDFLSESILPDYKKTIDASSTYVKDSQSVYESTQEVKDLTNFLLEITSEIYSTIKSITEMTCETSQSTANVLGKLKVANDAVNSTLESVSQQTKVVEDIANNTSKYKI